MKRALFLLPLALLVSCAKDCPEQTPTPPGYVCGPRSAYAFSPAVGTTIKVATTWKTRLAYQFLEGLKVYKADDICFLVHGTDLTVKNSDKEFVMAEVSSPPNDEPTPGGQRCPDAHVLIPVHQWTLMAEEAKIVDDEAASVAAKAARLKHAQDLKLPAH